MATLHPMLVRRSESLEAPSAANFLTHSAPFPINETFNISNTSPAEPPVTRTCFPANFILPPLLNLMRPLNVVLEFPEASPAGLRGVGLGNPRQHGDLLGTILTICSTLERKPSGAFEI